MGAESISDLLRGYAAQVPSERSIVEVGAWLGAGTYHLAAASSCNLYVYDYFKARQSEVEKAAKFGFHIQRDEDTLPKVQSYLSPYLDRITFRKGPLYKAAYDGPMIGLYVDDASKGFWHQAERIFAPYFDDQTILVLMDYHFPPCHVLRTAMRRHKVVLEETPDTSTAVFRW